MTRARSELVSVETTPYYHVMGRCVRRAFLCGKDDFSGRSFEHRKQWIVERLQTLTTIFAVEVCAYAVMSNHYHVVLRLRPERSIDWSQKEVIERWSKLYSGGPLVEQFKQGDMASQTCREALDTQAELWRTRLGDLSWFMRCLNEHIARKANAEDHCSGRFWEGRFKSQALLDEAALATCMTYVDLNPIRANLADTPEGSEYTSVKERIAQVLNKPHQAQYLAPCTGGNLESDGLPFQLHDYLELLDWSGRALREHKKGAIPAHITPILSRLGVKQEGWLKQVCYFEQHYHRAAGARDKLKALAEKLGQHWLKGQGSRHPVPI